MGDGELKAPNGCIPLSLTGATQEMFSAKAKVDVTENSPFKYVSKEAVLKDIQFRGAISCFQPLKAKIEKSPLKEIVLYYDAEFSYGESYLVILTEEGKDAMQKAFDEAHPQAAVATGVPGAEGVEGAPGDVPVEETMEVVGEYHGLADARPWESLGSEAEIAETSVTPNRELLVVSISRRRREFGLSNFKFADTEIEYNEYRQFRDANYDLRRMQARTRQPPSAAVHSQVPVLPLQSHSAHGTHAPSAIQWRCVFRMLPSAASAVACAFFVSHASRGRHAPVCIHRRSRALPCQDRSAACMRLSGPSLPADRQRRAKRRDDEGGAHTDGVVPEAQRLHPVQAARDGHGVAAVARRFGRDGAVPCRHRAAVRTAPCARECSRQHPLASDILLREYSRAVAIRRDECFRGRRYTTSLQQNETFDIMSNDFEAMIDEDFSLGNKNENHVNHSFLSSTINPHQSPSSTTRHWPSCETTPYLVYCACSPMPPAARALGSLPRVGRSPRGVTRDATGARVHLVHHPVVHQEARRLCDRLAARRRRDRRRLVLRPAESRRPDRGRPNGYNRLLALIPAIIPAI